MVKITYILFFISFMLLRDCITIDEPRFTKDTFAEPDTTKESGIPALNFQNGDLMAGNVWWTGSNPGEEITLEQKGGYIVKFRNVGPKYTPIGQTLPGLDFSDNLAIKIRAVAESDETPMLCLQLDDMAGFQTNAKRPCNRIGNDGKIRDYYFPLKGIFLQSWPSPHDVDPKAITKIMFFVNPGSSPFTGKIFFEQIKVVPIDSVKETEKIKPPVGIDGGIIDDFSGDISAWWKTDKFYKLSKTSDGILKVEVNGAGPGYEAFGRGFKAINFKNAYKLRVRARAEGGEDVPELRIDIKDIDGYTCNARPATNRIIPSSDGTFKDYIFSYKGRFLQTYPEMHEVDPERITELVIFVNAGKAPYTGTIFIDEIEAIYTGNLNEENK